MRQQCIEAFELQQGVNGLENCSTLPSGKSVELELELPLHVSPQRASTFGQAFGHDGVTEGEGARGSVCGGNRFV